MKLKTTVKVLSLFKYKYLLILMKWKSSAEENQTYQVDEEGFHVKNKTISLKYNKCNQGCY